MKAPVAALSCTVPWAGAGDDGECQGVAVGVGGCQGAVQRRVFVGRRALIGGDGGMVLHLEGADVQGRSAGARFAALVGARGARRRYRR